MDTFEEEEHYYGEDYYEIEESDYEMRESESEGDKDDTYKLGVAADEGQGTVITFLIL